MSKHTPGPLFVRQPEKWPFDIHIVNEQGETVFEDRRVAYSTTQKSVDQVMKAVGFNERNKKEHAFIVECLERQLADNYLRAAAPELLQSLKACVDMIANECADAHYHDTYLMALEAIAKAEGNDAS